MSGSEALCESLRQIAESIVDTSTQEGKTLLRAADEIEVAHEELDHLGVQRTSFAGPFGDIKYENRTLNLAGRIKCLGARKP